MAAGEAARFLCDYAERLLAAGSAGRRGAANRVKQLLRHWTAGDLVGKDRAGWLREPDAERLLGRLRDVAAKSTSPVSPPSPTTRGTVETAGGCESVAGKVSRRVWAGPEL